MADKAALRREMVARRDALPEAERERIAAALTGQLLALPEYTAARSVLATMSIGSEWRTRAFLDRARADGKRVILPRLTPPPRHLALHEVPDLDRQLIPGVWDIPEPDPARCPARTLADVDFALVPALAVDPRGYRLGYGAGYFDKLLARRTAKTFCVTALPVAFFVDRLPSEPHDIPLDLLVRKPFRRAPAEAGMTARVMDGKAIAAGWRTETAVRVERLRDAGITPGLAVVIVGEDPASQVYVRNKARACEAVGMHSEVHALAATISQGQLVAFIERLNADPRIHGILVQLPLPKQVSARTVIESIAPAKDVDGFHLASLGALVAGERALYPCTPWGVMKLLEHEGVKIEGAHAVVVGRSLIVGKPMAMLLLNAGATVTVCHSKTRDLGAMTREADILVAAVGRPKLIGAGMVKPGAVVIDVGVNRLPDGRLAGDVDFEAVSAVASRITPVPGGVGPMTIAMLLANTVKAAEQVAGLAVRQETRIA